MDFDYNKLLMNAIRKADIKTRNGDIFQFGDKSLTGEQLLSLTKQIVLQVENILSDTDGEDENKVNVENNYSVEMLSVLKTIASNTSEMVDVNKRILDSNRSFSNSEDKGGVVEQVKSSSQPFVNIDYDSIVSQLPEKRHGKGALNANKVLKAVVENQGHDGEGAEVVTIKAIARMSDSSVRDSIKYLDKNLESFRVIKTSKNGKNVLLCKVV